MSASKKTKKQKSKYLVCLRSASGQAIPAFKDFVAELQPHCEHIEVSSVFRVLLTKSLFGRQEKDESTEYVFCVALVFRSNFTPMGLKTFCHLTAKEVEEKLGIREGELLFDICGMEDQVLLNSELTIPHPELHRHAELLVPSLDVWPSYFHPVLEKKLSDLPKVKDLNAEFYCQGKEIQ